MLYDYFVHSNNAKIYLFLLISLVFHLLIFVVLPSKSPIIYSKYTDKLIVKIQSLPDHIHDHQGVLAENSQTIQPKESTKKTKITQKIKNKEDDVTFLPLEESRYYRFQELDSKPLVLKDIDTTPNELSKYPEGGNLTLQLWVDETGNVIRVKVLETDLPMEFSNDATLNFLKIKFSPGLKNNQYVKSTVKITVKYNPITNK